MDATTVAIILAYAEIKSLAELMVAHPDDDTERLIGEHILTIMARHLKNQTGE